jgi:putative membrane protein
VTFRWVLAFLHLLALGIGLGSVWARARGLKGELVSANLRRVLAADSWWGVAGALWIVTGLIRLFAGVEKAPSYYYGNHLFWAKMGLLVVILVLEVSAIPTFVRWRGALRRGDPIDDRPAGRLATISLVQAVLVLVMIFAATGMARGYGAISPAP